MYKLLLCWRYLRTRWIALASVVSVTLGGATMIVVNAVMAGFSHEMQDRIHGILSDIVFSTHSDSGFQDPDWHMREIRRVAGDAITGMTPTVTTPAMISFQIRGQNVLRPIMLVGIDEATHAQVSDFGRFLQHPDNRRQLSFDLREGGYDTIDSQADGPQPEPTRPALGAAGWGHRRRWAEWERLRRAEAEKAAIPEPKTGTPVRPAVSVDRQVPCRAARRAAAGRPGHGPVHRRRARLRPHEFPRLQRHRSVPQTTRRRRQDHDHDRRHAPEGGQRHVHGRRLL